MKKVLLGTFLLSIGLFMAGCSFSKETMESSEPIGDYRYEFLTETQRFEGESEDVINMSLKSDAMYYLSRYYREDSDYYLFTKANYNGEILNRFVVNGNIENPYSWNVLSNGNIAFAGYGDNVKTCIDIYDENGKLINYFDVSVDYFTGDSQNIFETTVGNLLIRGKKAIALYDLEGNNICENEIPRESKIIKAGDSSLYLLYKDGEKDLIAQINEEDLTLGEAIESPYPYDDYGVNNGVLDYVFAYDNGDSLFGFDESEGMVEIIRFEDSGTGGSGTGWVENNGKLYRYVTASGGRGYGDTAVGFVSCYTLRDKKREVLVLATTEYLGEINDAVANFNQSNDDYRIRVVTPEYSDKIEDWEAYKLKWLRKGFFDKSFDLVAFEDKEALSKFSIRWFISPLDKFIKKDSEVDLSDCFENVLSVGKYNDKLYGVVTEFGISTLVMSEKEADNVGLGSKQDIKNYISSIPNGAKTIYGFSRIDFLNFMLELNSDEFLNGKKYNFDNQAFIDILKEAKDYSTEDTYAPNWPDEEKEAFDSGKATIASCYMKRLSDYLYFSDFVFSEPIKCIGIPTKTGGINALYEGPIVSISKKSARKDGSWQFVKCFLTGKSDTKWDTPINKDSYYKHAGEIGEEEIWDSNAEVHKINPPTQEEIDAFYDFILSAKPIEENVIKDEVLDIIDEEALEFFKKKKTAEEAAEAVQERVNKYRKKNW